MFAFFFDKNLFLGTGSIGGAVLYVNMFLGRGIVGYRRIVFVTARVEIVIGAQRGAIRCFPGSFGPTR